MRELVEIWQKCVFELFAFFIKMIKYKQEER